jgi:hypothetical protein
MMALTILCAPGTTTALDTGVRRRLTAASIL